MEEIWKDVPGYEGLYRVSNLGKVMSLNYKKTGRFKLLKPRHIKKGYTTVMLFLNKIPRQIQIHQLVAMAFLNHTPCGHTLVVNHIDHDVSNNSADNLEIVTHRYNLSHRKNKGSSKYTGVYWNKVMKKYLSQICINGKLKHIGCFKNEDEAGRAYKDALEKFKLNKKNDEKINRRVSSKRILH